MKKRFTKLLLLFAIPISHSLSGLAQATKLTNFSYGPTTALGTMYPIGNNLYFVGRYAADTQEWMKVDLSNSNPSTNTQLVTSDHYRANTGNTIFRTPFRIGNNVFISCAKPTNLQDIEFSRFDLSNGTEQWENVYPGMNSAGTGPNYCDGAAYTIDPATGRVYFTAITAAGTQLRYWNPTNNTIGALPNINGTAGIGNIGSAGLAILGDTIYTMATINSYAGFMKINKNNGNYVFYDGSVVNPINVPRTLTIVNNKIFFSARTGATTSDMYNAYVYTPANGSFTKLTNYTTETLAEGNVGGFTLTPDRSTLFINVTYYSTTPTQGQFLSVNTLTNAVTYRSGPSLTDRNVYLHSSNSNVYVTRISGTTRSIYKINLASNAATLLTGTEFTAIGSITDGINGSVYMSATEPTYGSEVYSLNLATDAFTRLTDINTAGNSGPINFAAYGSNLYFIASATGTVTASSDYEVYSLPIATVLPLQLLSFSAVPASNGEVLLNWKVAEQHTTKSFTVERSIDGNDWTALTKVAANSSTTYQYTDRSKAEAVVYYRVREESVDGTIAYSETKKVLNVVKSKSFVLSTNPTINKTITVQFSAAAKAAAITITDEAGRLVINKKWMGGIGTLQIPVAATGIYTLGYQTETERVIVN